MWQRDVNPGHVERNKFKVGDFHDADIATYAKGRNKQEIVRNKKSLFVTDHYLCLRLHYFIPLSLIKDGLQNPELIFGSLELSNIIHEILKIQSDGQGPLLDICLLWSKDQDHYLLYIEPGLILI
jgi:hypothetical protein